MILEYYESFIEISKSNPMVAGAIGLWGAGLVTWAFRKIPQDVYNFLRTQLTTSITLNNASSSTTWDGNGIQFERFAEWFEKNKWSKWSRSFSLVGVDLRSENYGTKINISIGYGTHIFFYKRRLFWVEKYKLESSGTHTQKDEFRIVGATRNRRLINDLINEFIYVPTVKDMGIRKWEGNEWSNKIFIAKRPLNTVAVESNVRKRLISNIDFFLKNKDWYISKGMTYKQTYILHGEPGTGKTSLIKAIGSHYNMDIYVLPIGMISDSSLMQAFMSVPQNSIVIIEDFDSSSATQTRIKPVKKTGTFPQENAEVAATPSTDENFNPLTLSGLLNALDGIISINGLLVFLTTNHLENIDPALLRKGRVNYIENISFLKDDSIKEQIMIYFPDHDIPDTYTFADISGAELEGYFLEHHSDFEEFIERIPKK